jgi:SAM-dependent methyltransferase
MVRREESEPHNERQIINHDLGSAGYAVLDCIRKGRPVNAYSAMIKAAECGSNPGQPCDHVSMGRFTDRSGTMSEVEVWRCRSCGQGVSWPPLADVSFLYAGRESQDFQPHTRGIARWIKTLAFTRQARALIRDAGFVQGDILDFGCGSGLFTRRLGDLAPEGSVTGADFDENPPAELAGRLYLSQKNLASKRDKFDLVLAMHVLEHDDNPGALLDRIVAMARDDGTIVIEVPHIDCIWASVFRRHWDAWYLPYHRVHFSRQGLRSLFRSKGLVIEREIDVCVPTMGRTLANLCGRENTLPFLILGILLHPLQWLGEKLSRQPSSLRMVARRG